jgi:hypothetical protein
MKISFCITYMNRLGHLNVTFPHNLEVAKDFDVEFVLLNYNSRDEVGGWIRDSYMPLIDAGRLVYIHESASSRFHGAKSKNLAHRGGSGDILVNLDADNFLGEEYCARLLKEFEDPNILLHAYSKLEEGDSNGTWGRIAVTRDNFYRLGGYTECFEPYGYDDKNFIARAQGLGIRLVTIKGKRYAYCIEHSHDVRVENLAPNQPAAAMVFMNRNELASNMALEVGCYVANTNGWGVADVSINFKDKVQWEPIFPKPYKH